MPELSNSDRCEKLAALLLASCEQILARWRARVEADPLIENSPRLSRAQFYDHIPDILRAFCARLRHHPASAQQRQRESEMAHQHSRHRWQQGYSLKSLLSEWGDLNFIVLEELNDPALAQADGINLATLAEARLQWAEMVSANLSEGVAAYNELLQTEALARARDLERAFERAQQFERERGELLRQTSHDLRGNLSMVVHASELLQASQISPDERSQVTEILRGGVRTLSEMLRDLLAMSRLEAGKETLQIAPFDAAASLREMGESSQAIARSRNLWLRCEGPQTLPVEGDAMKTVRMAQNLLLNALKYTGDGGVVLSWNVRDERQWFFEILDTGPGLKSDPLAARMAQATEEARAIETEAAPHSKAPDGAAPPEAQPDPNAEVSEGIGLAIVRRLCELLDATLELDSDEGQGTRIRVVLPLNYAGA